MGTKISAFPSMTTPLVGDEIMLGDQAGETRTTTAQDIANLAPPSPPPPFVQSGARAFNSAGIDVSGFTGQLVPFDLVSYDTDSYYLGFDGQFSAPETGIYHVDGWFQVTGGDVGSGATVELRGPGGVPLVRFGSATTGSGGLPPAAGGSDYLLNGGELVGYYCTCDGTDAQLDGAFTIHAVGTLPTLVPPTVYLEDHFVDVDGTLLPTHLMDVGPGWTGNQGDFDIQANTCVPLTGVDNDCATSNAGVSDYALSATMTPTDDGVNFAFVCLVFRFVDAANFAMVQLNTSTGDVEIYEKIAGVYNLRASTAAGLTSGVAYDVAIDLFGTTVSATVNGGSLVSYGALTVGAGGQLCGIRLGLGGGGAMPATVPVWQDFLCTSR